MCILSYQPAQIACSLSYIVELLKSQNIMTCYKSICEISLLFSLCPLFPRASQYCILWTIYINNIIEYTGPRLK